MRPWSLSREVEICRVRAEASGEAVVVEGRGDQALMWKAAPLLAERSVCRPMLTLCDVVCVDRDDTFTIWRGNDRDSEGVLASNSSLTCFFRVCALQQERLVQTSEGFNTKHPPDSQPLWWISSLARKTGWPAGHSWSFPSYHRSSWRKSLRFPGCGKPVRAAIHPPSC